MKHFSLALMLGAILLAATGCASKDWGANHRQQAAIQRHFQDYEAVQKQMFSAHEQARAQMLQALSAAHQQLLAKVVGQLAIAPTPQVAKAANQIDAALTPKEKESILNVSAWLRNQWATTEAQWRPRSTNPSLATNDPAMTLLLTVTTYTARQTSVTAHAASSPVGTNLSH
jgi:hypothetical protein